MTTESNHFQNTSMNTVKSNVPQTAIEIGELCGLYAKTKWMKSFKAFDIKGYFSIIPSMVEDNEKTKRLLQQFANKKKAWQWQFQLRKGDKVLFETQLAA